jgi:hypothetical protein
MWRGSTYSAEERARGILRLKVAIVGLESRAVAAYSPPMDDTPHPALSPPQPDDAEPEFAPPGTPPHIAVAPGVLGRPLTVIREPGDSDETYQRRCELLAVLLDHAANQD